MRQTWGKTWDRREVRHETDMRWCLLTSCLLHIPIKRYMMELIKTWDRHETWDRHDVEEAGCWEVSSVSCCVCVYYILGLICVMSCMCILLL